jgi:glycosyltransferase involved in cell wall biosynthesis
MISVVIPAFNRADTLEACIESVERQRFPGLELIVIDDGSTDGTPGLLQKLKQRYPDLVLVSEPVNRGVNYARNRGIEKATRKFILFLDSDDRLAEGSLSRIGNTIQANPRVRHFLCWVSDRAAEYRQSPQGRMIYYKDWIKADVAGDFVHIVATDVMKMFPFFEAFRMYEYLNWLRVCKVTSPQWLAPFIVAQRDRNRPDSLTRASRLHDLSVIKGKFESRRLYYALHHADLLLFNSKALSRQLLATLILGVACNRKTDSHRLLGYSNRKWIKMAGSLILLIPPFLARKFIFTWSALR